MFKHYLINEDHLFDKHITRQDEKGYMTAEYYRNPRSIVKMMPYMRGIIDASGDLYVVDYEYKHPGDEIIHAQMADGGRSATSWRNSTGF